MSYEAAQARCHELQSELAGTDIICEPDCQLTINTTPNDSYFSNSSLKELGYPGDQDSAVKLANLESAWDIETGNSCTPPLVAVIDTGIEYTHPDLVANIWTNKQEISGNGLDDDQNGFVDDVHGYDFANSDADPLDDNGHGTHVAGTIGARGNNDLGVAGISWNARIMAVKFLSANGGGTTSAAIRAIDYAVANGAKVLNNSWGGGGYSAALEGSVKNAVSSGVLVLVAAGNEKNNNDKRPSYPANYSGVLSVAAIDKNGKLASFSNFGAKSVQLAAPGVNILSTWLGGSYAWNSGTSMATPHVSGAAALAWCKNPSLSAEALKTVLLNSLSSSANLAEKVESSAYLNVGTLLSNVGGLADIPEAPAPDPAESTPALASTLSLYDSESSSSELRAGKNFNLDLTSEISGNITLKFKVGRTACNLPVALRNLEGGVVYSLISQLPKVATSAGNLTAMLYKGKTRLASSAASIANVKTKVANERVKNLRVCKVVVNNLALR